LGFSSLLDKGLAAGKSEGRYKRIVFNMLQIDNGESTTLDKEGHMYLRNDEKNTHMKQ
jgi:hypothetical protein